MRKEQTQRGSKYTGIFEAAYNRRRAKVPKEGSRKKSRNSSFDEARRYVPDGPDGNILLITFIILKQKKT